MLPAPAPQDQLRGARDVICLSLEPWDEVWRRNELLAWELLEIRPTLRILFSELPVDIAWVLVRGKPRTSAARFRPIGSTGRLWAVAPRKWAPRRIRPWVDAGLGRQVLATARRLGFERPVLWINDANYAGLIARTGWPSVYDVTDDWLLAAMSRRELVRLQRHDRLLVSRATRSSCARRR